MKRTELQRRTRLRVRRTRLASVTPIARESAKRTAANRERAKVTAAMRAVSDGRCPMCGGIDLPLHGHERLARSHGGDITRPDVLIDDVCNGRIEDDPVWACWNGWKISGKHPRDPQLGADQARALNGDVVTFHRYGEVA